MPEALAPARAGAALAGELRVEVIVQVAAQNSLFDQDLALAQVALVVDVDRAAAAGDGAVVDDGDQLAGDFFAQLAGEKRGAFADEVGLQSVPDRFVQEDSAPARR